MEDPLAMKDPLEVRISTESSEVQIRPDLAMDKHIWKPYLWKKAPPYGPYSDEDGSH